MAKSTKKASFADTIAEKATTASVRDWDEEAFEHAGPNAPQSVKNAWDKTLKDTGIDPFPMNRISTALVIMVEKS